MNLVNNPGRFKKIINLQSLRYTLLAALLLCCNLTSVANQYPNEFNNYMDITVNDFGSVKVQLIALDMDGDNERYNDCIFSYSLDGGITYTNLLKYDVFTQDVKFSTGYGYTMTNYTSGNSSIGSISDLNIPLTGKQFYITFKWHFPQSAAGKTVKFKMSGNWIRDYATSKPKPGIWTGIKDVGLWNFNPSTSFSIVPYYDGKYEFAWAYGENVSQFDFYDNANFAVSKGTIQNSNSGGNGFIKLGLFNTANTYYVKQSYRTSPAVPGFSLLYEKKFPNPVTHPGYKYPATLNAIPKLNEQKVELGFTLGNTASNLAVKYFVTRNGELLTPAGITTTNYTDATVAPRTNYVYKVYTVPDNWSNKSTQIPELSNTITTTTEPKDIDFSGYQLKPVKGTTPYIEVSWDKSEWFSVNTLNLYRRNDVTKDWDKLSVPANASNFKDVEGIIENKYFVYKLEINQWGKISSVIDSTMIIDKVEFTKYSASKNTFGDRINLQWTIDRLNLCDRFEIYRSFAVTDENGAESWSKEVLVHQFTALSTVNSWDDRDAAPGNLYRYKVVAIKRTATVPAFDIRVESNDIGFRMPVGVITGRITYGSGTAVSGVSLFLNSTASGDDLYKSLKFSGDAEQGGKVNLTKARHGCIAENGFSFQAWINPFARKPEMSTIFEVENEYSIRLRGDEVVVLMGNPLTEELSYSLGNSIPENSYFNLAVTYSKDKLLKLYLNGTAKDSALLTATYTCAFEETSSGMLANNLSETDHLPYYGLIDDVRLWNRALTAHEAGENFNRYLGGSETGLIGYWPFDEGIGSYAFDCSKTDRIFNEHHITGIKKAASDNMVPAKEQLSIKGVTDGSGNYIIRGVPFTGEGSTYSITPVKGTHKFEPLEHLRYMSPSSLVHNGTDFVDKSSFPVQVTVRYKNTDYPVEGVSFSVDENIAAKENMIITTNEAGKAIIDLPIGEHYVKASLTGHQFMNGGRYPAVGKMVVDENTQSIEFTDTTLVSITGRVAGGLDENAKPVGFRKGKANIGQATLIITPTRYNNYSLNNIGESKTIRELPADAKRRINSVSGIEQGKSEINIKTDPVTGEFYVKVPPIEDWTVKSVLIKPGNEAQTLSPSMYNSTFTIKPLFTSSDTLRLANNTIDSCTYHVKQNYIYRTEPTITVTDVFARDGAYGDSVYVVKDPSDPSKKLDIKLYTTGNGAPEYLFGKSTEYPNGKPIFNMGENYVFKIEGYEEYFDDEMVSTKVPLSGALVQVENEMGKLQVEINKTSEEQATPQHELTLNDKGYKYYVFQAGFPKMTTPEDGMGLSVYINYNNKVTPWKENGKFRGIVLGYEPLSGSDFKTKGPGPLIPVVVLRDPPGSNSYAYMEKGTEMTYSVTHKHTIEGEFAVTNKLSWGPKVESAVGIGVAVISTVEKEDKFNFGLSGEYSSFTGYTNENTLTTTERIQTSSSPDFVGSMADVYIGTSTNVYSTECNFLNIKVDELSVPKLNFYTAESNNLETSTEFRLSQYEIMTVQIPKWQDIAKGLLEKVESYEGAVNPSITENRYITTNDVDEVVESMDHTKYKVLPPGGKTVALGNEVDSAFIHIKNWRSLIARNEKTKYDVKNSLKDNYDVSTISFDAGSVIERSYSFSTSKAKLSGNTSKTQQTFGTSFGFDINKVGVSVEVEQKFGGGRENENSSTTTNSTSFGFVLEDADTDNRFAVSVYRNKFLSSDVTALNDTEYKAESVDETLGSYIFELAAGQTSCPHEQADSTIFFTKNGFPVQLASGSQALDVPKMDVLPVKIKTDVPNGKEATFTLKLESGSQGFSPRPYVLSVDDASNKDGAILSVDGTPLTEGRTYYITKGEPLFKTLSVRQSKQDVLDYENLRLLFSSSCGDIEDAKEITVKFVPSCSDLDLVIDSVTMNAESGTSLLVKLRNFDQVYTNFMGIKLQYKLESDKNWSEKILAKKGVDFGVLRVDAEIPESKSSMDYRLNFKGYTDGRYQIRAMTICNDPNSTTPINNITPEIILVKDMIRPSAMGVASPSSGILTPEDEIAVTFNESLQTNRLVDTDFSVEGVLNGAALQHSEGLVFDGSPTNQAFTESGISLQNTSFAIEAWVQMTEVADRGTLFAIGEGENRLSLKLNKNSVALFVNNQQIGSAESITEKSEWQYISLNYDAFLRQIRVFVINSEENQQKLVTVLPAAINPSGRLQLGGGFAGKLHEVAVWNTNRSMADLADMNSTKSGKEKSIAGYWPLDEGIGKTATDKVRSRNLTVNTSWFIEPNGKSGIFNGNSSSMIINTAVIPVTEEDPFSIEFWFSGKPQANATLFSCGKGTGDSNGNQKLSIGFDSNGVLQLVTRDVNYTLPAVNVTDENWHHFAMSVARNGNTNIYIDGQQRLQIPSSKISGLSSDKMTIGSRSYYEIDNSGGYDTYVFKQDQFFTGKMDEIRIWKSALTSENIRMDMRSKLNSDAIGLVAYYPFEKEVNTNGKLVESSFEDRSASLAGTALASGVEFSENTPGIKMSRIRSNVNFSFTASDNKVILTINEPLNKIENCILEFSIRKVLDKNGNELTSPIKWTAFVNNNQLTWENDPVTLTKEVLSAKSFTATIVNKSGKYENYVLDALPDWLTVNKTSGRLSPLEKTELIFTVDNSINIGDYESRITLTGNNGIAEMLPVFLKVTGSRPDWAVNPYDYESSMNVTGQLLMEGIYQEDKEDMLAAFIDSRCVGLGKPVFNSKLNSYRIYLDVYGNSEDTGKPVTYSMWDAGTGRLYPGVEITGSTGIFVAGGIVGSVSEPVMFNASDKIEQQLSLKKGWNWISTNVVNTSPALLTQLLTGLATDGIMIKSRTGNYLEYSDGTWNGSLDNVVQKSMYLIKSAQPKTLKMIGAMAKSTDYPVSLNPNWNWIGYVPQFVAPVQVALSNLNPAEGDQIKGQIGFASYSGGSWTGSLEYLVPGQGYMYFSKNATESSFTYPTSYSSRSGIRAAYSSEEPLHWTYNETEYASSMTITGVVTVNATEVTGSQFEVAAFIDNVCRGTIRLKYVPSKNRYIAYLSVWGNTSDVNKPLVFKCFNNNIEITSNAPALSFLPDNIVGSTATPAVLQFVTDTPGFIPLFENFENGTKEVYNEGEVELNSGKWHFYDALLGNDTDDKVLDSKGVRLKNAGMIAMGFDKSKGAGIVSVSHANYGTTSGGEWVLQLSVDGGANWVNAASPVSASDIVSTTRLTINQPGAVRFRIQQTAGDRINIDNVSITDYTNAPEVSSWVGTKSSDWRLASNWSNGTPDANTTVLVKSTVNEPEIRQSVSVAAMDIEPRASLKINAGTTLNIAGNLTLLSNETGTAMVENNGELKVDGTTRVELYLTAASQTGKSDNWWYIASPVSGATSSSILVAESKNKFGYYNEATATYPQITNTSEVLKPGNGYLAQINTTGIYTFTGTLNNGDVGPVALSRTASAGSPRGFNLIGNPYPSHIDWNKITGFGTANQRKDIRPTIWVRTRTASGSMGFDTFDGEDYVSVGVRGRMSQYIAPMQAFWVKVNTENSNPAITFTNKMRSLQNQENAGNRHRTQTSITRQLLRLDLSNGINTDQTLISTNPAAENGYDYYDSDKLSPNTGEIAEIFTVAANKELAINKLLTMRADTSVTVGFRTLLPGLFTIKVSEIENPDHVKVILRDHLQNVEKELALGTEYEFVSDSTTTTSRFSILLRSHSYHTDLTSTDLGDVLVYQNAARQLTIESAGMKQGDVVRIFNLTGQLLTQQVANGQTLVINEPLKAGVYVIKVKNHLTKIVVN